MTALLSPRIPHLFTRKVLATALAPTYAAAASVDEEEAHLRLTEALARPGLLEALQAGISAALAAGLGPRTSADRVLDRVSRGVELRLGRVRALPVTPEVAAVVVRVDLEIGIVAEPMRATLATPRGAAALQAGLAAVGKHLVSELSRK